MSQVRRLAIVLMTVSIVTAAVYATGGFTSLTAQREANIQVTGDASGYLSLQPAPGPNGAYATQRGGVLRVSVGSTLGPQGGGVNKQAVTVIRDIFTITNHGSQPVGVWLTDESTAVTFTGGPESEPVEGRKQAVPLAPGETLFVGLTVDTRDITDHNIIKSVTIHAESEGAAGQDESRGSGSISERRGSGSVSERTISDRAPKSNDDRGITATLADVLTQPDGKTTVTPKTALSTASSVPFSDLLSDRADTSDPPVPRHAPTPSEDDTDESDSDKGMPRHAPTNPNGDSGFDFDLPSSDTVKTAALVFLIALPVDGLGPTDEIAALGWTAKEITTALGIVGGIFGGFLAYDHFTDEQTKHREDERTHQQQDHEETQSNQQTENDGEKSDGRRKLKPPKPRPPLVPDGGKDRNEAVGEMKRAGIPVKMSVKWSNQGYDVVAMNDALTQYQKSGETLRSMPFSQARGDFGEIIAKQNVKSMYPSSQGYEYIQGVKLKRNSGDPDITEIDWVVIDTDTGNVVAIYQVKSGKNKADDAQDQLDTSRTQFKKRER